jgi:hypothetical protein
MRGVFAGAARGVTLSAGPGFTIACSGNCSTPVTHTPIHLPVTALMGGHVYPGVSTTADWELYAPLLIGAGGGIAVVLTADTGDDCGLYGPFFMGNPVAPIHAVISVCFTSRAGAFAQDVGRAIAAADMIFLTGGDQAKVGCT